MRRIDPDALYRALTLRWTYKAANEICPEVAEPEPNHSETPKGSPEPYDYRNDWYRLTAYPYRVDVKFECRRCGHTQGHMPTARHACPERPAEPVIDEAVYEAAFAGCHKRWPNTVYGNDLARHAAELAVLKDRELRSSACTSSNISSSVLRPPVSSPQQSVSGSSSSLPQSSSEVRCSPSTAHAADPRRLTDSEIWSAYSGAGAGALRAVANAQFEKVLLMTT